MVQNRNQSGRIVPPQTLLQLYFQLKTRARAPSGRRQATERGARTDTTGRVRPDQRPEVCGLFTACLIRLIIDLIKSRRLHVRNLPFKSYADRSASMSTHHHGSRRRVCGARAQLPVIKAAAEARDQRSISSRRESRDRVHKETETFDHLYTHPSSSIIIIHHHPSIIITVFI